MIAALKSVRRHRPKKIIGPVPVSSYSAKKAVRPFSDELAALVVDRSGIFAVTPSITISQT